MKAAAATGVSPDAFPPDADRWSAAPWHEYGLFPVPVNAIDTSKYVRDTRSERDVGAVESVRVRAVADEATVAIQLQWPDPTKDDRIADTHDFVDKASVAFPVKPGASVMTMGSTRAPLNAWFWRADRREPYDVLSEGFGTTDRRDARLSGLACRSRYEDGHWSVVFTRPRPGDGEAFVDLADRRRVGVSFAVWDGDNDERGPLKSFSGEFRTFGLEG